MPIIHIDLFKGRTVDQKRAMVKRVTEAISETLNCPKEAVSIIIKEMEFENYAKGGKLEIDSR